MRGFSSNANFSRLKELLDLNELGKDDGFQYLCTQMQELTREQAPLLQLRRYMDFEQMKRHPGEKPDAFITRWTIAYNQVKKEAFSDITEHAAAVKLFASFGFTKDETAQVILSMY